MILYAMRWLAELKRAGNNFTANLTNIVIKRNYLSVGVFYIILILIGEKTMKNSKNRFGILVLALVFGLTAIGCEEDPPEETIRAKTLAITMPRDIFKENFLVGLFPVGTSL